MRAGIGLIGLLITIGIIAYMMGKTTSSVNSEPVKKAQQQANQFAGNSTDGSMRFSDSLILETETKGGKISAVDVTKVTPGGPAETYFGLKEGDAIVEIGPLAVRDQINSTDDAKAFVQDAYQKQQTLVVMRDGDKLTLPQGKPQQAKAPSNSKNSGDPIKQQMDLHSIPGMP